MLITVSLLNGFKKPLSYQVPSNFLPIYTGDLVVVPLKKQLLVAIVNNTNTLLEATDNQFTVRNIIAKVTLPNDKLFQKFIRKVSNFYCTESTRLYDKIYFFLMLSNSTLPIIENENKYEIINSTDYLLTEEQQNVVNFVAPFINNIPSFNPILLHGVTGSGKTEIYKKLIETAIKKQKTVLFLLPEISLCLQFEERLKKSLPPSISITSFHSATSINEKKRLWQKLINNTPQLILGVHLPIFLPIPNLGLIIIDEEHEQGFEEKQHPKINSKQAALIRAQLYNIPIILGSATPSLTSLYNITHKNWHFFQLKKRYTGTFPTIKTVNLTAPSNRKRRSFWISYELEQAIKNCLEKKEQIIIYLNRRGFSFFIQCKSCGFVFSCPNCSVSLTAHTTTKKKKSQQLEQHSLVTVPEEILLRCHYCPHSKKLPTSCPSCKKSDEEFIKKGIGTQQAVQILKTIFPSARIERADMDNTKKQATWAQTIKSFEEGYIDILVGTKTITKGYHFPRVTLVGILWADLNLHIPQFDASERALQQLIQVAGRAGRESNHSTVIVQSIQNHPIFDYLNEEQYLEFAEYESQFRKEAQYPPYCRLLQLELRHKNPGIITREANLLSTVLHKAIQELTYSITILGPTKPLIHRVQKIEIRHIFLKSTSYSTLHQLVEIITKIPLKSLLYITPQ